MTPSISAAQGICSDKPFPERKLQHFSDDEVEAIVRSLSGSDLRMAPEGIAAEIEFRARTFLQERSSERRARHRSKIARDLRTGLDRVRRCSEDLQGLRPDSSRRALKRATGRINKLLRWLDGLDQDLRDALFIETILDDEGRPVEDPATIGRIIASLQGLDDPHGLAKADGARLDQAASALTELSELIKGALHMIEGPRSEKTSHRRSKARRLFLDQLADLFVAMTGCQPTFTRDPESGMTTKSQFAQFALTVLKIVDPETVDRQLGSESDIQAAVGRKQGRCHSDDETVIKIYEDPRDRKLSRRRISQQ